MWEDYRAGILCFETQERIVVLPKFTNPERIRTNLDIHDFELTDAETNCSFDARRLSHDSELPALKECLEARL